MNELKFRPKFSDEVRIKPRRGNFYYNYNIYESVVTTAKNLNIEHYFEIVKRIEPFLYYLASFTITNSLLVSNTNTRLLLILCLITIQVLKR